MNETKLPPVTVVCREMSKDTGDIVSYVVKENITDRDAHILSLRGKFNPELRYYAFADEGKEKLEKILKLLKRKSYRDDGALKDLGAVRL